MARPSGRACRCRARRGAERAGRADGAVRAARASDGLRLLAAEDNPTNRRSWRRCSSRWASSSIIVGDGQAAVEAWRSGDYDLILMDIQMPVMDGHRRRARDPRRRGRAAAAPAPRSSR